MFEGRSIETKKNLIKLLYQKIEKTTDIILQDLEIIILEAPKCNWGIRGITGEELNLNNQVDI